MYIPVADSYLYMAEIKAILYSNHPPIKTEREIPLMGFQTSHSTQRRSKKPK